MHRKSEKFFPKGVTYYSKLPYFQWKPYICTITGTLYKRLTLSGMLRPLTRVCSLTVITNQNQNAIFCVVYTRPRKKFICAKSLLWAQALSETVAIDSFSEDSNISYQRLGLSFCKGLLHKGQNVLQMKITSKKPKNVQGVKTQKALVN